MAIVTGTALSHGVARYAFLQHGEQTDATEQAFLRTLADSILKDFCYKNIVRNDILDLDAFRAWRPEFKDAEFILREQVRLRLGDRKDVEVDVQRREPRLHRR